MVPHRWGPETIGVLAPELSAQLFPGRCGISGWTGWSRAQGFQIEQPTRSAGLPPASPSMLPQQKNAALWGLSRPEGPRPLVFEQLDELTLRPAPWIRACWHRPLPEQVPARSFPHATGPRGACQERIASPFTSMMRATFRRSAASCAVGRQTQPPLPPSLQLRERGKGETRRSEHSRPLGQHCLDGASGGLDELVHLRCGDH